MFESNTLGRTVGLGDLIDLTGPQLRDLYNEVTGKNVGKFSTRAIGIERTAKALKDIGAGKSSKKKTTVADKPKKKTPGRRPNSGDGPVRRKKFDAPFTGETRPIREGTKRHALVMALTDGATFEECQIASGWHAPNGDEAEQRRAYKICFENIMLLHTYIGFGLTEDDNGVIRLLME